MTTHPFSISTEESAARLLEALRILNQISNSINHIGSQDASQNDVSLQLIVNSAMRVVPGSSAVIYTYDDASATFEVSSRVSAEALGQNWVRTLMTRLGGSVGVESDGQDGTTFRLHLPRERST